MTTDIFIVSCEKHYPWLRWALKSIVRFASGFRQVMVAIPEQETSGLNAWLGEFSNNNGVPIRLKMFKDWPGRGFLCHEWQIISTDQFTDADYFVHLDSDTLFYAPVTPADYFVDGKPVLMHASYDWLHQVVQANLMMWRETVVNAIGGSAPMETMRRHPAVHPREIYALTREMIEKHTGRHPMEYVHSCREEFPQGFCEFNTLGAVAWRHLHDKYHWIDHQRLHETGTPWPDNKLCQFWGHGPVDVAQEPVYEGKPFRCTPEELLKIAEQKYPKT
jgi:hypothetical protein